MSVDVTSNRVALPSLNSGKKDSQCGVDSDELYIRLLPSPQTVGDCLWPAPALDPLSLTARRYRRRRYT
jgi:hypothetical protein